MSNEVIFRNEFIRSIDKISIHHMTERKIFLRNNMRGIINIFKSIKLEEAVVWDSSIIFYGGLPIEISYGEEVMHLTVFENLIIIDGNYYIPDKNYCEMFEEVCEMNYSFPKRQVVY